MPKAPQPARPLAVETHRIQVQTRGNSQVLDLTPHLADVLARASVTDGVATLFVVGSTAGITTTEFEPGLAQYDLKEFFERIAPEDAPYRHEATWGDDNGHAHVRASLLGPSLAIPFCGRQATLGQWQQVVLIDFDTRPRTREVVVQLVGDAPDGTGP